VPWHLSSWYWFHKMASTLILPSVSILPELDCFCNSRILRNLSHTPCYLHDNPWLFDTFQLCALLATEVLQPLTWFGKV
jgi:hypothetical protein